jgi:hypothetical protein
MNDESRSNLVGRALALVVTIATAVIGAGGGCAALGLPADRLQTCQSNDDCKKKDPKLPTCANLRCVECAYDTDCESGLCTESHCKTLFKSGGEEGPDGPPENLDACLSRCKEDQTCVNKCHDQFPPVADPPPSKKKK